MSVLGAMQSKTIIGTVPEHWNLKIADEISLKISKGTTPPKDEISSESLIPFLRVNNLSFTFNGCLDFKSDFIFVSRRAHEKFLSRSKAYPEDVLMNIVGPPLGKIALLDSTYPEYNMNQAIVFFRLDKTQIDVNYFIAYLSSFVAQEWLSARSKKTSGQQNLTIETCKLLPVPLPPLPEQQKIAQILSIWDKAITTTEQLLFNSQQQKKALMQQLLTGKKRFYSNGNYFYSVREGFARSKLGTLPSDWKVELIKKHLWYQEGPGVRNHQFTEQGVKLFNGTNIQFNKIDLSNTTTHISEEECIGAYKHFLVDDGDLLIACSGISVDRFDEKIAFASSAHLPLCMNTSTMRFKPLSGGVDITYFHYFMQSLVFKNQIRRQATGSAQLNFGPSHIGKCFVVIPSMEEQQKISTVLTTADREIELLQTQLEALKQEKKALMQQLLTGKRRVKMTGDA